MQFSMELYSRDYNPFPPIIEKKSGRDGQVVQGADRKIWQVKQRWARRFDPTTFFPFQRKQPLAIAKLATNTNPEEINNFKEMAKTIGR